MFLKHYIFYTIFQKLNILYYTLFIIYHLHHEKELNIVFYIVYYIVLHYGRKFRSETSDNMGSWKSRGGKSQKREEKKREDQRGERVRRKKMEVREKVGKSRFTVFFQCVVVPEGPKVGKLKRRVRSHVAR